LLEEAGFGVTLDTDTAAHVHLGLSFLGAWVCSRVIGFGVWYSGSTLPRDVLSLAG